MVFLSLGLAVVIHFGSSRPVRSTSPCVSYVLISLFIRPSDNYCRKGLCRISFTWCEFGSSIVDFPLWSRKIERNGAAQRNGSLQFSCLIDCASRHFTLSPCYATFSATRCWIHFVLSSFFYRWHFFMVLWDNLGTRNFGNQILDRRPLRVAIQRLLSCLSWNC